MDGSVPTYDSRPVYCEAVRFQVARANTANLPDENVYTEKYNYEGLVGKRLSHSLGYSEINHLWNSLVAMNRNQNLIGRLISSCALVGFLAYFLILKKF